MGFIAGLGSEVIEVTSSWRGGEHFLIMGYHCMGSHFHNWFDYNEVAFSTFSIELLEWDNTFLGCWG